MQLPQTVLYAIHALEAAGFQGFAVGGCVRDSLLGLTPADFDLCTDATPPEISQVFRHHHLLYHCLRDDDPGGDRGKVFERGHSPSRRRRCGLGDMG